MVWVRNLIEGQRDSLGVSKTQSGAGAGEVKKKPFSDFTEHKSHFCSRNGHSEKGREIGVPSFCCLYTGGTNERDDVRIRWARVESNPYLLFLFPAKAGWLHLPLTAAKLEGSTARGLVPREGNGNDTICAGGGGGGGGGHPAQEVDTLCYERGEGGSL